MAEGKQGAGSLLGTVLDGFYRVERLLGEGGMGSVFLATQLRLDKPVAVKVMARELASNQEALERFRREARVTSGLGHPHIVQVFDFSTTPTGEPFLVMELLEGEDLDRRLRRVGRLPAKEVVHVVRQVASALSATHAKGIVHRDLKPGNIYLLEVAGEKDFVKVVDFGISKIRFATTKLTRTSSVIGTPSYMSPEQARGNIEDIDESTDQWALACIAWECLTGAGPFVGENVPSILFQIVHEPPPSLLRKVAGLPRQFEKVLVRALSKDKADRFPTVTAFAEALEASLAGPVVPASAVASTAAPASPPLDSKDEVPPPAKSTTFTQTAGETDVDDFGELPRRPKWIWAIGAGATLVVVVGAALLFRTTPPKQTAKDSSASAKTAIVSPPTLPAPAPEPVPRPELAAPEVVAPEPATPPAPSKAASKGAAKVTMPDDPFESVLAKKASPYTAGAKQTRRPVDKKPSPDKESTPKPSKARPQRKIIEEL